MITFTEGTFASIYDLGWSIYGKRLVRIPSRRAFGGTIPPGCVRILTLKRGPRIISPYDEEGLRREYWALPRYWAVDDEIDQRRNRLIRSIE